MSSVFRIALGILLFATSPVWADLLVLGDGSEKPARHLWYDENSSSIFERFCKDYPRLKEGTKNVEGPCAAKAYTHDHLFPHKLDHKSDDLKDRALSLRFRILDALRRMAADEKLRSELISDDNPWYLAFAEDSTRGAIDEMLSLLVSPDKLEKESESANTTSNAVRILELAKSEGLDIALLETELSKELNKTTETLDKRIQYSSIANIIEDTMKSFENAVLDKRLKIVGRSTQQSENLSAEDREILAALAELVFRDNAQKLGTSMAFEVSFTGTNNPPSMYIDTTTDHVIYFTGGTRNSAGDPVAFETNISDDQKASKSEVDKASAKRHLRFDQEFALTSGVRARYGQVSGDVFRIFEASPKNGESIVAILTQVDGRFNSDYDNVRLEFWLVRK